MLSEKATYFENELQSYLRYEYDKNKIKIWSKAYDGKIFFYKMMKYNDQGKIVEITRYNNEKPSERTEYKFDQKNKLTEIITTYLKSGQSEKLECQYDSNDRLIKNTRFIKYTADEEYRTKYIKKYTYENHVSIEYICKAVSYRVKCEKQKIIEYLPQNEEYKLTFVFENKAYTSTYDKYGHLLTGRKINYDQYNNVILIDDDEFVFEYHYYVNPAPKEAEKALTPARGFDSLTGSPLELPYFHQN